MSVTDEEFGRAWASESGVTAEMNGFYRQWWWRAANKPATSRHNFLSAAVFRQLPGDGAFSRFFDTEAAAYAALGLAVRAVHAAVPPLDIAPGAAT